MNLEEIPIPGAVIMAIIMINILSVSFMLFGSIGSVITVCEANR